MTDPATGQAPGGHVDLLISASVTGGKRTGSLAASAHMVQPIPAIERIDSIRVWRGRAANMQTR